MNKTPPVFLLASERSGTNLLRRRLTEFQKTVFGPSPVHLLKELYYTAPFYGDLTKDEIFENLISDTIRLTENHIAPWKIKFFPDEVLREFRDSHPHSTSIVLLTHFLYLKYAESKGFLSYFCKDNNLMEYAWKIITEIPEARFIYLHRDPRDYVLSQIKRLPRISSVVINSELWRDEQTETICLLNDERFKDHIYKVGYEEFLDDETAHLNAISEKFNLERLPQSNLQVHEDKEGTKYAGWENLDKPTMKTNYNKYLQEMSKKQIDIVEAVTWNQMKYLGYKTENTVRPRLRKITKAIDIGWASLKFQANKTFRSKKLNEGREERIAFRAKIRKRVM